MSVVIRMAMPKSCKECQCEIYGCCGLTGKNVLLDRKGDFKWLKQCNLYPDKRPLFCPIICELPNTHGNLVDFDDVKKELDKCFSYLEQLPESFYQPELYRKQYIIPEGFIEIPSIVPAEYSTSKVKQTEDMKP